MPMPGMFRDSLTLPVVCAPMFLVSSPELVIEQCRAGLIGTMPSLNMRPQEEFEGCVERIRTTLERLRAENLGARIAPFGINLIVHRTNIRLEQDLDVCVRNKVPLVITSLGASGALVERVHSYGGLVFHDVTNMRHARKAIGEGVDGIILVAVGAGGHAGGLNPIALVRELRAEFDGTILLSGAISDGAGILAALAMGADMAYVGSRFIATVESGASQDYKNMVVAATCADIICTSAATGVPANYLRPSFERQGIDPAELDHRDVKTMSFASGEAKKKAWRDIWGCGQGIGVVDSITTTAELVEALREQFAAAQGELDHRLGALA